MPTSAAASSLVGIAGARDNIQYCQPCMLLPGGGRSSNRLGCAATCFADLPDHLQRRILLTATTHACGDLLRHVARCAQVCTEWMQLVRDSPAYGAGITGPWSWAPPGSSMAAPHGRTERDRVLKGISAALCAGAHRYAPSVERHIGGANMLLLNNITTGNIGGEGARALGAALLAMRMPLKLRKINLYCCGLVGSAGIAPIAEAMRRGFAGAHDPGLQGLFLNANIRLGDDGLTQLAPALPRTLVQLAFGSTGCGDRGMAAIAAALCKLTRLETLDCGGNSAIGIDGWAALAGALPHMPVLRVLWAGACEMGDDGVAALAAGLPSARALSELHLDNSDIGSEGACALASVLRGCRCLTFLSLAGNDYSADARSALVAAELRSATVQPTCSGLHEEAVVAGQALPHLKFRLRIKHEDSDDSDSNDGEHW